MKRPVLLARLLLVVLLFSTVGWSQTTSVTLQVTDADGQSWNNGTYSVTLVQQSGVAGGALSGGLNGVVFRNSTTGVIVPNQLQTGSLNGTGGASLTLTPNASIGPLSAWAFTVCPQATASCYTQQVQIAGASQTVTLTPLGPRISMINPPPLVLAYSDTELLSPSIGQQYFNLITHAQRQWNGSVWSSATTGVTDVSGADPTGIADSYTAIQAAITAAIAAGKCLYLPPGTYKVSAGLTAPSKSFCMAGLSPVSTTITASGSGYNVLTVGPGTDGSISPSGSVSGIAFIGHGKPSVGFPTGISAFQLNAVPQFNVHDIEVDQADIGIDLINNSFGSQFTNIRGCFGGTCNVGINLRTGSQSGSDVSFYNPWVDGAVAGVEISGGAGGFHFFGGQINGGQGTGGVNDSAGAVIMGLDYLTAATGESGADFHGTSFEGTNYAWIFRTFQQVDLNLDAISANPSDNAHPAIGFFKGTTMNNSRINLSGTALSGYYSAASLLSVAGSFGGVYWWEKGTYTAASNPTINSTPTYVSSMAAQSGILPSAFVIDNVGIPNAQIAGNGGNGYAPFRVGGTPGTGFGATGTVPLAFIAPFSGATAVTHWSANGTMFGIVSPDVFTGNLIDIYKSNSQLFFLSTTNAGIAVPWAFAETTAPSGAAGYDYIWGDSTAHRLETLPNNGTKFLLAQVLSATSSAFATATTAGTCVQNTTAVAGATTSMVAHASPVSTPGVGAVWSAFVSSSGNVTINECAVATSAGGSIAFNILVGN